MQLGEGRRGSGFGRRESMKFLRSRGSISTDSKDSFDSSLDRGTYRVVVLGGQRTGKTAIISQFLYDQYNTAYKETVEEMYRGEFEIDGTQFAINIQDTGGSYVYDFPSMVAVSLQSADAVLLVFSVDNKESFEEARRLRDLVMSTKGPDTPIVFVGNKTDLDREVAKEEAEATVVFDWENGYAECSAKENSNIQAVFKEVLNQAKANLDLGITYASNSSSAHSTPHNMRRRQSLPQVPSFQGRRAKQQDSILLSASKRKDDKSKNSCKMS